MAARRINLARVPLAPVIALMIGTAVAIVVAAMPVDALQTLVSATGLDRMLDAARPPLGLKARLFVLFTSFALVTALVWGLVALAERMLAGRPVSAPVVDDDVELDLSDFSTTNPATPRRPIFADRELGAPLMSDAALETAATRELDDVGLPLPRFLVAEVARHDEPTPEPVSELPMTEAVNMPTREVEPDVAPAPVVAHEAELAEPLVAEDFALEPDTAPDPTESSIDALIRRLEDSLARRGPPKPPGPAVSAATPTLMRDSDWLVRAPDGDDGNTTQAIRTLRQIAG